MQVREARPEDATAILTLFERLYSESTFLLFEPGEVAQRADEYAQRIREAALTESGVMFLAESGGQIVGIVFGNRGTARRIRHSILLVMGVLEAHWSRGIGSSLLRAVEGWAAVRGLHRLELTVQKSNPRAVALYRKAGFEIEGTKRDSLRVADSYVDEWFMSKLIAAQPPLAGDAPQAARP